MPCVLDHLVITAPTLDAGAAFVQQSLGVSPQPGGKHPRMATHNLLLRLGDTCYLEVIAADPAAPAPGRPRWFALDALAAGSPPALAAWVAGTPAIRAAAAVSTEPLGTVEAMSRGALEWLITVPADGSPPLGGIAPALIEWGSPSHPAAALPNQSLSLVRLELFHPQPERVIRLLQSLGFQGAAEVHPSRPGERPHLAAHIDTPEGLRRLGAP